MIPSKGNIDAERLHLLSVLKAGLPAGLTFMAVVVDDLNEAITDDTSVDDGLSALVLVVVVVCICTGTDTACVASTDTALVTELVTVVLVIGTSMAR